MAATLYSFAVIRRLQKRLKEADEYAKQSLSQCEALGLRAFTALVLYEQSRINALQHEFDRAYELCSKSIVLFRELGRTFNLVYALNHLGKLCQDMGEIDNARKQWMDALTIARSLEHPLAGEIDEHLAMLSTQQSGCF